MQENVVFPQKSIATAQKKKKKSNTARTKLHSVFECFIGKRNMQKRKDKKKNAGGRRRRLQFYRCNFLINTSRSRVHNCSSSESSRHTGNFVELNLVNARLHLTFETINSNIFTRCLYFAFLLIFSRSVLPSGMCTHDRKTNLADGSHTARKS